MTIKIVPLAHNRKKIKIVRSYRRDKDGKSTIAIVEDLGFMDELEKEHPDVIAWAKERARQLTEEAEKSKFQRVVTLEVDNTPLVNQDNPDASPQRKNLGYSALSRIYHELELDKFIDNRKRNRKFDFNAEAVVRTLVYNRCLDPSSKKAAWEKRGFFFEDTKYSLDQVYTTMDFLAEHSDALISKMDEMITKNYGRDSFYFFYDVTNYYFEIDKDDTSKADSEGKIIDIGLRRKGCSKEHRTTPIIQMGLFMDKNGLPVSYDLFRGNMHDSQTLIPMIEKSSQHFKKTNLIVVADKGMMSGDNIREIRLKKQGYIISNSVRKADKSFHEWIFEDDYSEYYDPVSGTLEYKIKERITPRNIKVSILNADGSKTGETTKVTINERQIIVWSRKYAEREREKRNQVLEKVKNLVERESSYATTVKFGARKYILKTPIKKGKVVDVDKYIVSLDEDLVNEEASLDGYYAICTNVVGIDGDKRVASFFDNHPEREAYYHEDGLFIINRETVTPQEIVDIYHGLWRIEETFRVTKSTLETRPVFHWTERRIEAHFLICFIALTILRILQYKLNWNYSASKIRDSLMSACGTSTGKGSYIFDFMNTVLEDIGKLMDIDFSRRVLNKSQIRELLGKTKKI